MLETIHEEEEQDMEHTDEGSLQGISVARSETDRLRQVDKGGIKNVLIGKQIGVRNSNARSGKGMPPDQHPSS